MEAGPGSLDGLIQVGACVGCGNEKRFELRGREKDSAAEHLVKEFREMRFVAAPCIVVIAN